MLPPWCDLNENIKKLKVAANLSLQPLGLEGMSLHSSYRIKSHENEMTGILIS
jgi:hypothetical protein